MKRKFFNIVSMSLMLALLNQSCNSHSDHVHEGENITKVTLTFQKVGSTDSPQSFSWVQGEPIPTIQLRTNSTYNMTIAFFNGAEDITSEIIAEKDEHFITYGVFNNSGGGAGVGITRTDGPDTTRSDGKKLGIYNQLTTTFSMAGTLNVKLYHQPTSVVDSGGGGAYGGDLDVNVNFPLMIND